MKEINEIKNKIKFDKIINFLSGSKFDFNKLHNNINTEYLYSIYRSDILDNLNYYVYIGNMFNNLYFIPLIIKNVLNPENFQVIKSNILIVTKYRYKQFFKKLVNNIIIVDEYKILNLSTNKVLEQNKFNTINMLQFTYSSGSFEQLIK